MVYDAGGWGHPPHQFRQHHDQVPRDGEWKARKPIIYGRYQSRKVHVKIETSDIRAPVFTASGKATIPSYLACLASPRMTRTLAP
jgi:hypothetical protein